MKLDLERAIILRKEGKLNESNERLVKLADKFPEDPLVQYHCAWSFDALGHEAEAVPYYKTAIQQGLSGEDLEGALLGLGSTYRTLGQYEESKATLEKGISLFPNNNALKAFYAMSLYNVNEHSKAMEILLKCLTETSNDPKVIRYKRAIDFYSNKLDTTWK
ncbi:tetratricopeptide repeat protein [Alteribacter populi]|uniref:tetratricopeptide repeat protein n=1 Tax=Alteribacter populi TaxID=2011011 RepID=UPI000BBAFD9A|nr:tetratricopeptide repeat protein [Alteribacter populi]